MLERYLQCPYRLFYTHTYHVRDEFELGYRFEITGMTKHDDIILLHQSRTTTLRLRHCMNTKILITYPLS